MSACNPRNKPFFDHIYTLKQHSRIKPNYTKACTKVLESLTRYPLPIKHENQISALDGVGSLFAKELEGVLQVLQTTQGPTRDSSEWRDRRQHVAQSFMNANNLAEDFSNASPPAKKLKLQTYPSETPSIQGTLTLPGLKSGAFNLLVSVLLFAGGPVFSFHQVLTLTGQLGKLVPGLAAVTPRVINSLIEKGWIKVDQTSGKFPVLSATSGAASYRVTEEGWYVANRLRVKMPALAYVTAKTADEKGSFDAVSGDAGTTRQGPECQLLVCPRELSRGAEFPGEPRPLPLGDFAWVWKGANGDERFGGILVERKSVQDLASSIIDGRYDEQKGRIMRVPSITKVIFLIEEDWGRYKSPVVSADAIRSAMRSIQLISGFQMITTLSIDDSAKILQATTDILSKTSVAGFKTLPPFAEFSVSARKSGDLSIKEITLRMLLTIPGLGPEAISAISDVIDATYLAGTTIANLRLFLRDFTVDTILAMTKETRGMKRSISSKAIEKLKLYLSVH
jgi:ERCC4-type nuclease